MKAAYHILTTVSEVTARETSCAQATYSPGMRNAVMKPHPAPPAKADSHTNVVMASVDLGGRLAHNLTVRSKSKQRYLSRQQLQLE